MARPKNPDNVLEYTCAVTQRKVKTNPTQFKRDFMQKYNLSREDMLKSCVSSGPNGGRRIIAAEGLTPEQAMEKYGLHENVAKMLKCTVKPTPVVEIPAVAETPAVEAVEADTVVSTETTIEDIDDILIPEVETDAVTA
jgi:hypothetical protein